LPAILLGQRAGQRYSLMNSIGAVPASFTWVAHNIGG
jgi:hypothetical protein